MFIALHLLILLCVTLFFLAVVGGFISASHSAPANFKSRARHRQHQKRKKISFSTALFLVGVFFNSSLSTPLEAKDSKDSEERSIHMELQYEKHEGRIEAEYTIQAPVEAVWALIRDQEAMVHYVPKMLYSRFVTRETADNIQNQGRELSFEEVEKLVQDSPKVTGFQQDTPYLLQKFDFPWPMSNRWTLTRWKNDSQPQQRMYSISYILVAGTLKKAGGGWSLRPHPSNPAWTLARYRTESDIGFQAPAILIKSASKKTTREILEAIRNRAEGSEVARK